MLQTTHEYARRLIAGSKWGKKNGSGYWLISRSWAEKFARLRRLCRDYNKKLRDVDWLMDAKTVEISILTAGGNEKDAVHEYQLGILVEVFGPLPLVLGSEEASIFRAIEIFNTKRDFLGTLRTSWTDDWASRIKRLGTISIDGVEPQRLELKHLARHGNEVQKFDEANRKAAEEQAEIEELLKGLKLREAAE
jgi:hypothetical protein